MRLFLIGNYPLDRPVSMDRYAEMLRNDLSERGHTVAMCKPWPLFGRLYPHGTIGKWLGYIDKYLLFPPRLFLRARGWDHVHICDHSNSVYLPWLPARKSSITCHDVIAIDAAEGAFPECEVGRRVSGTGRIQQAWIKKNLMRARRILAVSESTAGRLRKLGARGVIRVIPLHTAFQPAAQDAVATVRSRLALPSDEPYLLHVGGNHWYKNRMGVLRIFAHLRRQQIFRALTLVMVGPPWTAAMREYVRSEQMENAVREVLDISDADLEALYTGAEAFLFPSFAEGLGWPVMEAQSCGTFVITSDREALREVAGEGAIFVDPTFPEPAAAAIAEQWPQREEVRSRGVQNVLRFAPEALVDACEEFFRREPSTSWTS